MRTIFQKKNSLAKKVFSFSYRLTVNNITFSFKTVNYSLIWE